MGTARVGAYGTRVSSTYFFSPGDMLHVPYGDEYGGASGVRLRRTQSSRARRSSVL